MSVPSQEQFLSQARSFWQKRSPRELSEEDARQIYVNLSGFFDLLQQWHQRASGGDESFLSDDYSEEGASPGR